MEKNATTLNLNLPEHGLVKKVVFMTEMKFKLQEKGLLSREGLQNIEDIITSLVLLYIKGANVAGRSEEAVEKKAISELNLRNAEERLVYQLVDYTTIKTNGLQSWGLNEQMEVILNKVVESFIWLYMKGLNLSTNPREILSGKELEYYEETLEYFGIFQDFMRTNMHLTL